MTTSSIVAGIQPQHTYDIPYAEHSGHILTLDVHAQPGLGHAPVVLWFHGGGWAAGDSRQDEAAALWPLAAHGIVVVSANYRLSASAPHPAQHDDAATALTWIAGNIAEFGGDPTRVFVAGASAGGHLAALTGLTWPGAAAPGTNGAADSDRPVIRGILPYFPVVDPQRWDAELARAPRPASETFSGRLADLRGSWPPPPRGSQLLAGTPEDAIPADLLRHQPTAATPPFLILHGRRDSCVDVSHSVDLAQHLSDHDVEVTTVLLSHADHVDPQFYSGPVLDLVTGFIRQHSADLVSAEVAGADNPSTEANR